MAIDRRALGLFILGLAIVVVLQVVIQQNQDKDVAFCRNLYAQLAKGSLAVGDSIDWENFQLLGNDLGAMYARAVNPKEKSNYRATFIRGFAIGFKYLKGQVSLLTNWRVYHQSDDKVIVACDNTRINKTLLFTVSKSGPKRKLVAIDWRN